MTGVSAGVETVTDFSFGASFLAANAEIADSAAGRTISRASILSNSFIVFSLGELKGRCGRARARGRDERPGLRERDHQRGSTS